MRSLRSLFGLGIVTATLSIGTVHATDYTQLVGWNDPFLNNPFHVSNAMMYQEGVRYWGPTTPNVEGVVTLKFDVPFAIQTASFAGGISAYTTGSDLNLDPNASTFLEVSTDNLNWTTVSSQTNQNAFHSGLGGPWDLSTILAGSNVAYIRSRLFMTTPSSSISPSQFMRQGPPYDPGYFTASDVPMPLTLPINLEFDSSVPGAIADRVGYGTGFTHRLPGTGASIATPDPNLSLLSSPGYLNFTSTRSAISKQNGFGRNLENMDAPGVLLSDMVGKDFRIVAKFDDVVVPDLSDQLLLYVGLDEEHVVQAGMHEFPGLGQFVFYENTGVADIPLQSGPVKLFTPGDDLILSLSRTDGLWTLEWENLTNPAGSDSYPPVAIPWLDGEEEFYVGLMHQDSRNFMPQTATIDYFRIEVVPEPAGLLLSSAGVLGCCLIARRRT